MELFANTEALCEENIQQLSSDNTTTESIPRADQTLFSRTPPRCSSLESVPPNAIALRGSWSVL